MDSVLVIVTVLSLAIAGALALVVAKLLRDERNRSAARVEALVEMAAGPSDDLAVAPRAVAPPRMSMAKAVSTAARRSSAPTVPLPDLELGHQLEVAGVRELFSEPVQSSPWPRRVGVAVAILTAIALGAAALTSIRGWSGGSTPAAEPASVESGRVEMLELLSLRHTQSADTLTITGLVQNPRDGRVLEGVSATVFLFGSDGTFLGSGRAPLDFTRLAPGDECPFVITVATTGAVARYRVGFRAADGRVITHVDRRTSGIVTARR